MAIMDWPITRQWQVRNDDKRVEPVVSADLREVPALCLLGSAGSGKSHEMDRLYRQDLSEGKDAHFERLADLVSDEGGLAAALARLSGNITAASVLYLDALDESMVHAPTSARVLGRWIERSLKSVKPHIRISCRSARLPASLQIALENTYTREALRLAVLAPLSDDAIRTAASASGIGPDSFFQAVLDTGSHALAQHPLTFKMLVETFKANGRLPQTRNELFRDGVQRLALERDSRRIEMPGSSIPVGEILRVAEYLACFSVLSGRENIDLNDDPVDSALALAELLALKTADGLLTAERIEAVGASGLCNGQGDRQFRFVHRQVAEYLAGRVLAGLPLHQAKSMLAGDYGWRAGVAAPLRETATFAANESQDIARWLSEADTSVIRLSDVASPATRRRALLTLLEKYRSHELTDAQALEDSSEFEMLKYDGAAKDLRPWLLARDAGIEDVQEFVLRLAKEWKLSELSEEIASLMLDERAAEHPRVSAGHALRDIGTASARRRVKSLLTEEHHDPDDQLFGMALHCNWPDAITVPELLTYLKRRRRTSFHGAYESFLFNLEWDGFDASGARLEGLDWAEMYFRADQDYEPTVRIAKRTVHAALSELDDPRILARVSRTILGLARRNAGSPLGALTLRASEEREGITPPVPPLYGKTELRRKLFAAIAAQSAPEDDIQDIVHENPSLVDSQDFAWLVDQALDSTSTMVARRQFALAASVVFPMQDTAAISLWLDTREMEPIRSAMPFPLFTDLSSPAAEQARRNAKRMKQWERKRNKPAPKVEPPPDVRVLDLLDRCERKDFRFFHNLCPELTLKPDSTSYGHQRFLTSTPGWATASVETRTRIVNSAQQFLEKDSEAVVSAQQEPLNSILTAGMAAIWLVKAEDPSWLAARSSEWWTTWAWYIIRELHPHLHGETDDPKSALLLQLHGRVPVIVRGFIECLCRDDPANSRDLLRGVLDLLRELDDPELDRALCVVLTNGDAAADRIGDVTAFVLRNDSAEANRLAVECLTRLAKETVNDKSHPAVGLAASMLLNGTFATWDQVITLLKQNLPLAKHAVAEYAHTERLQSRSTPETGASLDSKRLGTLLRLLFETFPPEDDPKHDGAYWLGPADSARDLRHRVLNALTETKDVAALEELRSLERDLGTRYPWLRRPRSRVEQALWPTTVELEPELEQDHWSPRTPQQVASLLYGAEKRLIRSPQDALDGIMEAIRLLRGL